MITSRGMWVSAAISAVISLHSSEPRFLFYGLVFCALGIFLEGRENAGK